MAQRTAPQATRGWLDGIAVSASMLCLVHCLALPVLAAGIPALALFATHETIVHWVLLAIAVPIGLLALGRGRAAAGPGPLIISLVGFGLMAAAAGLAQDAAQETRLTVAGVLLVALAHTLNLRAARGSRHRAASRQSRDPA